MYFLFICSFSYILHSVVIVILLLKSISILNIFLVLWCFLSWNVKYLLAPVQLLSLQVYLITINFHLLLFSAKGIICHIFIFWFMTSGFLFSAFSNSVVEVVCTVFLVLHLFQDSSPEGNVRYFSQLFYNCCLYEYIAHSQLCCSF